MECETYQVIPLGTGPGGANLVIGRILWIHVDDRLFDAHGEFEPSRLDTIGRMGDADYVRTRDRFSMQRPRRPS